MLKFVLAKTTCTNTYTSIRRKAKNMKTWKALDKEATSYASTERYEATSGGIPPAFNGYCATQMVIQEKIYTTIATPVLLPYKLTKADKDVYQTPNPHSATENNTWYTILGRNL